MAHSWQGRNKLYSPRPIRPTLALHLPLLRACGYTLTDCPEIEGTYPQQLLVKTSFVPYMSLGVKI